MRLARPALAAFGISLGSAGVLAGALLGRAEAGGALVPHWLRGPVIALGLVTGLCVVGVGMSRAVGSR